MYKIKKKCGIIIWYLCKLPQRREFYERYKGSYSRNIS